MIKFRAWHKEYKQMRGVKLIAWLEDGQIGLHLDYMPDGRGQFHLDEKLELMQWTGLVDKNGKELYEGDIVVFYPPWGAHAHLVERSKTNHNLIVTELYVRNIYPDEYNELDEINFTMGIIEGNRWEQPELLNDNENEKE